MTTIDGFPATNKSELNQPPTIQQAILEAITEAREICDQNGMNSPSCAVAWDIVEELQAENAHQKQAKHRQTSLESYCEMYPDALECLIYDL
ncbi:Calvin cycle protein CP12 [Anabaena sp. UHCC 0451]|uniref:Calvin cycle protein CP12 n=1 Tax=Anabaena sp. UHCC 0451 TaxID=2055235 RepID=UPI002B21A468|nr:Calvin cycle protein CP12 [Anabaena sp. UHCC 0451]MEA5577900.1 Calvin cycle protein CP12 [Anabaena sp. UHCC 0451]